MSTEKRVRRKNRLIGLISRGYWGVRRVSRCPRLWILLNKDVTPIAAVSTCIRLQGREHLGLRLPERDVSGHAPGPTSQRRRFYDRSRFPGKTGTVHGERTLMTTCSRLETPRDTSKAKGTTNDNECENQKYV